MHLFRMLSRVLPNSLSAAAGLLLCLNVAASVPAWGQLSSATVTGLVRDPTGASIAGASVKLQSVATNVVRSTVSNGSGNYTLLDVPPGQYTLSFSAPGFQTQKIEAVELAVNQTLTVEGKLTVGKVDVSVTVEADSASVESSSAELGSLIGEKTVHDLPLNGRNFTALLTLTPGVTPISVGQNSSASNTAVTAGSSFTFPSVNGQGNRQNYFLVDGMSDQQAWYNTYAVAPIVDSIQEFKVNSHNDAQFGQVTGGVINVATKAGGNQLHGDAWEYLRNTFADARPYLNPITPLHQNQFGGTLGGPIVIPRLYNGHDKTFFFVSAELFRYSIAATTSTFNVPTAAELNGDYSALLTTLGPVKGQLYDPHNPSRPFPNNQLVDASGKSLVDPGALAYAKLVVPAPIVIPTNPAFNGQNSGTSRQTQENYSGRIDQTIGTRDFFFFRYSGQELSKTSPSNLISLQSYTDIPSQQFGASWVHMFSPTASLQVQYSRAHVEDNTGASFGIGGVAGVYGLDPSLSTFIGGVVQSANLNVSNYFSGGESSNPSPNLSFDEQYKATFSKTLGRHQLQAGGSWDSINYGAQLRNGTLNFTPAQTVGCKIDPVKQTCTLSTGSTGDSSASFLLGYPSGANKRNINISERPGGIMSFYAQDSWKVTPRLTANYGLRYDRTFIPAYGKEGTENQQGGIDTGDFDFNNGTYILQKAPSPCSVTGVAPCLPGSGALPANVIVSPDSKILHDTTTNFGPRLALAYRVNERMAIRGGFGIFFDNWAAALQLTQNYQGSWPDVATLDLGVINAIGSATYVNPHNPFGSASATLPGASPFVANNNYFVDPNVKNPYSEQYNAGIQQELGNRTILTLNYVGSQSHRLDIGAWYNTGQPSTLKFGDPARANQMGPRGPQPNGQPFGYILPVKSWDRSIGKSNYNALQASLARSLSRGLAYTASYTWSKTIDEGASGYFGVEGNELQDPYNIRGSRGVAAFNIPQVFSLSVVYDVPVGKGRSFSTHSGIADYVLGNWQINTIFIARSGQNFTINTSGDPANTGNGGTYARATIVPGVNPIPQNRTAAQWFNTAAFAAAVATDYTQGEGNSGRNVLQDQSYHNVDASIFRRFPIYEQINLEFRAEAFNALNNLILGTPGTTVNVPAKFGLITSQANSARQMQFALKLVF